MCIDIGVAEFAVNLIVRGLADVVSLLSILIVSLLLSIETTSFHGSIALFADGDLLACESLDTSCRSAQSLAPGIKDLIGARGKSMSDLDCIAVAQGPGSFTGLRVGITTAKMLAYSLDINVIGVNTLDAMALGVLQRTEQAPTRIDCVLDAQRQEVFIGRYERTGDSTLLRADPIQTVSIESWLNQLDSGVFVAGDLLKKLQARDNSVLEDICWENSEASAVDDCNVPSAQWIGLLALQPELVSSPDEQQLGETAELSSAFTLLPRYYRRSAAEEKLG